MSNLIRETSKVAMTIHEKWAAWVDRNTRDARNRTAIESIASPYDSLDYRLMATFPASDAVAQY